MGVFVKFIAFVALVVGVLLTSTGCPDSSPIGVSNSEFVLSVSTGNPVGRFVDGPTDQAEIRIRNLALEPFDEVTRAALGNIRIDVTQSALTIDFPTGTGAMVGQLLPAGIYRVAIMEIIFLEFEDNDPLDPIEFSDPMNPTCEDFVKKYKLDGPNPLMNILPFNIGDVLVTVQSDGTTFTVEWNWPELLSAIQQAQTCSSFCSCPGGFDPMNPNDPGPLTCECSTGSFNRGTFRNLASSYFSFSTN